MQRILQDKFNTERKIDQSPNLYGYTGGDKRRGAAKISRPSTYLNILGVKSYFLK